MNKNNVDYHQMERKQLGKGKRRILDFTSLFPFHLMIIYIIFVHTSVYVMVLQVGKICVLDLPLICSATTYSQVTIYVPYEFTFFNQNKNFNVVS